MAMMRATQSVGNLCRSCSCSADIFSFFGCYNIFCLIIFTKGIIGGEQWLCACKCMVSVVSNVVLMKLFVVFIPCVPAIFSAV